MDDVREALGSLADRYEVVREITRGPVSSVYLIKDLKHDRQVALKLYHPQVSGFTGCDQFLREIQITASLQHPNILPLLDSGNAGGLPYYVMPFVEGESLRERLIRERQLPLSDAVRIAREVAGALDHAHRNGVVHRDIKPENILLSDGHAVVMDFGIAWALNTASCDTWGEASSSVGTAAYMSPEQVRAAGEPDGRSDLYSLGATLYEMLAGRPPFTGPSPQSLTEQHLSGVVEPLTELRPATPDEVASVVHRTLEKNPADRFASAGEFLAALPSDAWIDALQSNFPAWRPKPGSAWAPAPRGLSRANWQALVGLGTLAVAVMILAWRPWVASAAPAMGIEPAVAVLPFAAFGPDGDPVNLAEALTQGVISELAEAGGLGLPSRTSMMTFRDTQLTLPEIATQLHVDYVVEGSVRGFGEDLRVSVELMHGPTDRNRWAASYSAADYEGILALQDAVGRGVLEALRDLMDPDAR